MCSIYNSYRKSFNLYNAIRRMAGGVCVAHLPKSYEMAARITQAAAAWRGSRRGEIYLKAAGGAKQQEKNA